MALIKHLPMHLPDETLYSLIARIGRLSGWLDPIAVCAELARSSRVISSIDFYLTLEDFSGATSCAYGEPRQVAADLTPIRLVAHLGGANISRMDRIEAGREAISSVLVDFVGKPQWRTCPMCRQEDQGRFGVAYWHQQHQLITSLWCVRHGSALERLEFKKTSLHDRFILPGDPDGQGMLVPQPGQNQPWREIAQVGAMGLADKSAPASAQSIRHAFLVGMCQKNFLTRKGSLRKEKFIEELKKDLGDVSHIGLGPRRDLVFDPVSLLTGLEENTANNTIQRLILVYWLFGTWEAFKERCAWEEIMWVEGLHDRRVEGHGKNSWYYERMRAQHRSACMLYKKTTPQPTRQGFWELSQKSMHWLIQNDREWVDEELPIPMPKRVQRDFFVVS